MSKAKVYDTNGKRVNVAKVAKELSGKPYYQTMTQRAIRSLIRQGYAQEYQVWIGQLKVVGGLYS